MKILSKIAIGAALVLVAGAMIQPAWGACTTARVIGSSGAYLVSNPDWGGAGGSRTCSFGYGCYANDPDGGAQQAPISPNLSGSFWAFPGFGVPGPGGIDNGTWDSSNWTKQVTADFGQPYFYAAFLTTPTGPNSSAGNPPNWGSDARIDGCVTDSFTPGQIDPEECTCVQLTDEWDVCIGGTNDGSLCSGAADCPDGRCESVGFFAVLSSFTDALGDFDITPSTSDGTAPTIILSPLAPSSIVDSTSPNDGATTLFTVGPGPLNPQSVQTAPGCDCGLAYKVYSWRTGRGGLAPSSRSVYCSTPDQLDCWGEALAPDGSAQAPTPFNGAKADADVRTECDPAQELDLYLSTRLVLDPASGGGFAAGNVSANSFQVACGDTSNIAEPNRPDRDEPRGRSDQAPRGRGNNRSRGNR